MYKGFPPGWWTCKGSIPEGNLCLRLSHSLSLHIYIYIYIPEKQIKRKEQIQCQPLHPQLPQEVGRFYHALDTSQEFDDLPDDQGNADYEDDTCQTSGA